MSTSTSEKTKALDEPKHRSCVQGHRARVSLCLEHVNWDIDPVYWDLILGLSMYAAHPDSVTLSLMSSAVYL